jgi:hypothetical protein
MRLPRPFGALVALVCLLTACSATGSVVPSPGAASPAASTGPRAPFVPVIISSEQVVGKNRFLIGLLDTAGSKSIGGPDTKVEVAFTDRAKNVPPPTIPSQPARFVWAIQGERGIYVVDVEFPDAGNWAADVTASGGGISGGTVEVQFQVAQTGHAIPVGGKAPDVKTPTLADVGGDPKKLSTDQHPDPAFYTTSVDQAIATHQLFVLVFATPAFCTSRQCGPTLDGVKAVATGEPGVTFINVEPYRLQYANGQLQPVLDATGQLQATDVTNAWGILSEPWVFVVDREGIVRASFEAVISPDELRAAIDAAKN